MSPSICKQNSIYLFITCLINLFFYLHRFYLNNAITRKIRVFGPIFFVIQITYPNLWLLFFYHMYCSQSYLHNYGNIKKTLKFYFYYKRVYHINIVFLNTSLNISFFGKYFVFLIVYVNILSETIYIYLHNFALEIIEDYIIVIIYVINAICMQQKISISKISNQLSKLLNLILNNQIFLNHL